jgi:hypothetical protein
MLALGLFLKVRVSMAVLLSTGPLHPPPPPPGGHELLASPRMPWDYLGCRNPLSSKGQHIARIASLCGIPSAMATGAGPHVGT